VTSISSFHGLAALKSDTYKLAKFAPLQKFPAPMRLSSLKSRNGNNPWAGIGFYDNGIGLGGGTIKNAFEQLH